MWLKTQIQYGCHILRCSKSDIYKLFVDVSEFVCQSVYEISLHFPLMFEVGVGIHLIVYYWINQFHHKLQLIMFIKISACIIILSLEYFNISDIHCFSSTLTFYWKTNLCFIKLKTFQEVLLQIKCELVSMFSKNPTFKLWAILFCTPNLPDKWPKFL